MIRYFACVLIVMQWLAMLLCTLQDEKLWPLMPPLPSYGYGREHPGPRYGSLIHGRNLTDVTITGNAVKHRFLD